MEVCLISESKEESTELNQMKSTKKNKKNTHQPNGKEKKCSSHCIRMCTFCGCVSVCLHSNPNNGRQISTIKTDRNLHTEC